MSLRTSYSAIYSIDATGRGTIASTSAALPSTIFYLLSANKALLLETAGSTVQVGSFEPQLPLTYNNALLIGQFIGAGPTPPPYGIVSYDGTGIYTATLDINSATAGLVSGVSSSWSSSRLKPLTA